ncbi:MAG: LysM peptidoglycan-binding domain-containing protein [Chloroflexota bacterium]|nr:LysM peptidoglycan-binding domain-containing protein [Chloroflexota bacterium]
MAAYKICPICGTRAHRAAAVCQTCGASLTDVTSALPRTPDSDPVHPAQYGDDDLLERRAEGSGRRLFSLLIGTLLLIVAVGTSVGLVLWNGARADVLTSLTPIIPSVTIAVVLETNTPPPTPRIATITPMPPTATATASPSPCTRVVQPGDNLISIIFNCGYRELEVLPLVLELNQLDSPEVIQQGQTIIVPLPTPIPDADTAAQTVGAITVGTPDPAALELAAAPKIENTSLPLIVPTETLLPGIGIHVVQPDESMVSIAYQYRTNAETLSQLNPEIPFSQCDFSLDGGGPRCTVLIGIGQQMRVPAPTPTASLSPTLTGSETATPQPTPTYNAPNLIAPDNRIFFLRDQLITLRWVGTGSLSNNETYLIIVENMTSGETFRSQTRDLAFVIPEIWQGTAAEPADYRWAVGVIDASQPDSPRYLTSPRLFTWQGRAETSENS